MFQSADIERIEKAAAFVETVASGLRELVTKAEAITRESQRLLDPQARPRTASVFTGPRAPAAPSRVTFDRGPRTSRTAEGAPALRSGARKLLATLARHHPVRVSRAQFATLAGFTVSGGTFQTYLSDLRRGESVYELGGLFECTVGGLARPASKQATR